MEGYSQYLLKEEDILKRFKKGEITREEMWSEIKRNYKAAAEEAAKKAYRDELEKW